ncbi:glycoside hydrolase family 3 protein [Goodfellowiella coeruleoviolacea]|nr:glycoside hydrolase family 3 protein [Goodfellowiella coeruleoviolacea]
MHGWVTSTLRRMSLEDKIGQLFVTYVHGQAADEPTEGSVRDFGVATSAEVVKKFHPGGVIYFNNSSYDNIDSPKQVAELSNGLQRAALSSGSRVPLIISTDQEQGIVTRITAPATQFPGNMALGASRSPAAARQAAAITGRELRAMGIGQNFAPDADVNSNPQNPVIGVRSFSSDPALAAQLVAAQVHGYQDSGRATETVSAAAKHFPGHGDTSDDSHYGLPEAKRTKEQWSTVDAPPFRAAIDAGIDVIMSAHITMPKIDPSGEPATLSKPILTGMLRDELGFDGVVVTDSLAMAGVRKLHSDAEIPVLALKAGVDQLLMPVNLELAATSVLDAVRRGEITEQRIDQSVTRILKLKYKRGLVAKPLVDVRAVNSVVGNRSHLAEAQRITDQTVTALRNDANLLPLTSKPASALVTGWGSAGTVTTTLANQIAARGPATTALDTGSAPTAAQISAAVDAAGQRDLVVVLTYNLAGSPAQQQLVDALVATGKPVVAVAVRNPYDTGYVPSAQTWLATYFYGATSTEALTKVLFGEIKPRGKLPVDVPDGADATKVRYPLGFGLSW